MEPMNVHGLVDASSRDPNLITVECTVLTGFEFMALDECREKCRTDQLTRAQGRIFVNIPIEDFSKVKSLRSVDNVYLVSASIPKIDLQSDKEKDLDKIKDLIERVDWDKCVCSWAKLRQFTGVLFPKASGVDGGQPPDEDRGGGGDSEGTEKDETDKERIIKFRATCNRAGTDHSFTSMEAAAHFGGCLQDKFEWTVDLSHYDLEIVLNISSDSAYICAALTSESMHKRNITHFSPTTLRATMCYNMLRLAAPQSGETVIDPMAGGGSISIEGCLGFEATFHLAGDSDEKAVGRSKSNADYLRIQKKCSLAMDILRWDVTRLPLRDQSADVLVTDLPFGKRSGKKKDNRWLYRNVLEELARVVRVKTGRAVLLTADKNSFLQAFGTKGDHPYWKRARSFAVNQGGLSAMVFLLLRNSKVYTKF